MHRLLRPIRVVFTPPTSSALILAAIAKNEMAAVHDVAADSGTLSVKVYVNGHWNGQCVADLQRPDLVKAGVSCSGRAGFAFRFEARLHPGDVVHVRACANPTALARDTHVIG